MGQDLCQTSTNQAHERTTEMPGKQLDELVQNQQDAAGKIQRQWKKHKTNEPPTVTSRS